MIGWTISSTVYSYYVESIKILLGSTVYPSDVESLNILRFELEQAFFQLAQKKQDEIDKNS